MTSAADKNCTFLISTEKSSSVQQEDICKDLESPEVPNKIRALKNAITSLLAGEPMPRVLMTVIRFCITQEDHMIKKLLMLYWEIVPKYGGDAKLLPEMILVCNALRNDLTSPNEFIRGCMLRFLCKLKEPELLEPLIPSVKLALEHRHSYVRRNAALAVYSIHRNFGEQLLPDAPELMEKFISSGDEAWSFFVCDFRVRCVPLTLTLSAVASHLRDGHVRAAQRLPHALQRGGAHRHRLLVRPHRRHPKVR